MGICDASDNTSTGPAEETSGSSAVDVGDECSDDSAGTSKISRLSERAVVAFDDFIGEDCS